MVPTQLGEQLASPLRDILLRLKSLVDIAPEFVPEASTRQFKLTCSDCVATAILTDVLAHMQQVAPLMGIEVRPLNDICKIPDLSDIDFAIAPKGGILSPHPTEELFTDDHVCAVWSGNRFVKKSISFEQYSCMPQISYRDGRETPILDDWMRAEIGNCARNVRIAVPFFNLIPQLLIGTSYVAIMPRRLAKYYAHLFPIRIVDIPFELPRVVHSLYWHEDRSNDVGCIWFRSMIKQVIETVDSSTTQTSRVPEQE